MSVTTAQQVVVNPATAEAIAETEIADADAVGMAVAAAEAALPGWLATTPKERGEILLALASKVEGATDDLARLEALNVGKPLDVAIEEVAICVDVLRFFAGAGRLLPGQAAADYAAPGSTSVLRREPIGVVGLITPWNYPLLEATWKIAPALAAGNTCVLKPSELTPLTTLELGTLASELMPAGVLNVVTGNGVPTGDAIVRHPRVRMVSMTGDVATGMRVAAAAAETLTRVHLELGGKAPVLVMPDADPSEVAQALRIAGFVNAGQDCTAACRVIVHERVYEALVEGLVDAVSTLTVGDSLAGEPAEMGPVISERQRDRVLGFVDRARDAGGSVRCGGEALDRPGFFVAPTVITGVAQDSEIVQNEVFGPVVTVQRASSTEEMLEMANGVRYGLSASVWTNDLHAAKAAERALEFGTVWVNEHLPTPCEMPFGGFGHSGYGKELSTAALEEYTRTKHILTKSRV